MGPQAKSPGSLTSNRHVSPLPSGDAAQALPSAAKVMLADAEGSPWSQPAGRAAMSATGPVGVGGVTEGDGPDGEVVDGAEPVGLTDC